jgi:phage tail-like protein
MATGELVDPYNNYRFVVEINGVSLGIFTEVSGFDSTIDVIEYREGGDNTTLRKLPGMTKYSNIVLKWGITDEMSLYKWHRDAVEGEPEFRKSGSIVLLDRAGEEVARWNFVRAWPTKYDGPDLNAEGTDVAIETLELAHEGVERV